MLVLSTCSPWHQSLDLIADQEWSYIVFVCLAPLGGLNIGGLFNDFMRVFSVLFYVLTPVTMFAQHQESIRLSQKHIVQMRTRFFHVDFHLMFGVQESMSSPFSSTRDTIPSTTTGCPYEPMCSTIKGFARCTILLVHCVYIEIWRRIVGDR